MAKNNTATYLQPITGHPVNTVPIQILNPRHIPDWNRRIVDLPGATIFHTANWARVLEESYGYKPKYVCSFDNGKITHVIPVMAIDSFVTGKRGVCLPFSDVVNPLVGDPDGLKRLHAYLMDCGRKNGWRSLVFHGADECIGHNTPVQAYIHSWIALNGSPDALFKKLKSSNRRNIKKAEKSGVKVDIVRSMEGIEAFYRLNCLTRKEHGLPPQPLSFFKKIHAHVVGQGKGFVCLASIDDTIIAGVVIFHFNGTALYKYGASDRRFLHLRPNNLCMWRAIAWCSKNGFHTLDLGRTDMDHHGLLRFKRSWNAKEDTVHYYKYDFGRQCFLSEKPKLKTSYAVFQRLPVPLLRLAGQMLYRHVG